MHVEPLIEGKSHRQAYGVRTPDAVDELQLTTPIVALIGLAYPLFNSFLPLYLKERGRMLLGGEQRSYINKGEQGTADGGVVEDLVETEIGRGERGRDIVD